MDKNIRLQLEDKIIDILFKYDKCISIKNGYIL